MSIETRVVPFSRSFRTLIKHTRRMSKSIKDLKDLRAFCVWAAIDIKVLQTLRERETLFSASRGGLSAAHFFVLARSARACPSRSVHGEGQALALR